MEPKTLQEAILYFADPDNCVSYVVARRWPDGVVCPTCGRTDVSYVPKRRLWQCKTRHPKSQFSVKVGTIFEDSAIPLDKWLMAMWMIANCRNGVSSYEIARALGITQKSAWFMLHRVRLAMKDEISGKLGGGGEPVEVDETFVGGDPQKMHRSRRRKLKNAVNAINKVAVMGMLDRETREVRANVIPNVKRETLLNEILKQIKHGSTVFTDGWQGYINLDTQGFVHETVTHLDQYVRGEVSTQALENFWSLLKRSLKGTYVAVEPFHLNAYVNEQIFRFNNRIGKKDGDRFSKLVGKIVGKRLTYEELTGKDQARPF